MSNMNDTPLENTNSYFDNGSYGSRAIMTGLYRAAADRLNKGDLERLAQGSDQAANMLLNLSQTIVGIGCLVATDMERRSKGIVPAGNFQGGQDLPDMLFSLSESIDAAVGLIQISEEAGYRLSEEYKNEMGISSS